MFDLFIRWTNIAQLFSTEYISWINKTDKHFKGINQIGARIWKKKYSNQWQKSLKLNNQNKTYRKPSYLNQSWKLLLTHENHRSLVTPNCISLTSPFITSKSFNPSRCFDFIFLPVRFTRCTTLLHYLLLTSVVLFRVQQVDSLLAISFRIFRLRLCFRAPPFCTVW